MSSQNRIRDAAIVLNSLSDEAASDIFSRLDGDCQQQLNESLDLLDTVSGDEFHSATSRFRKHAFAGGKSSTNALADSFLWPRGGFGPADDPFAFLKFMDVDARRQLPANVALVMATLDPPIASSIMDELDAPFRIGVIRRLCELTEIDETQLIELRFELRMRAKRFLAIANCTRRGISVAADLLSLSDQRTRDGVLAWLNDRDNELAAEL
jgi:flagellar motor switch protein FliG